MYCLVVNRNVCVIQGYWKSRLELVNTRYGNPPDGAENILGCPLRRLHLSSGPNGLGCDSFCSVTTDQLSQRNPPPFRHGGLFRRVERIRVLPVLMGAGYWCPFARADRQ